MKSLRIACASFYAVSVLSLAVAPAAAADEATEQDLELFRTELINYISDLETLPISLVEAFVDEPMALVDAREQIQSFDHAELARIRDAIDQVPYWRQLPGFLATSLPTEEYFSPLELAASLDPQQLILGSERAQHDLTDFLDRLAELPQRFPEGAFSPGFEQRVGHLRTRIEGLAPGQRLSLRQAFNARAPQWGAEIRQAMAKSSGHPAADVDKNHCGPNNGSCNQSFPQDVLCEIDNVISEIAAIPCKVGEFATAAGQLILDSLLSLLEALENLLPTVDDLIATFESVLPSAYSEPDWPMKIFPGREKALIDKGIDPKAVDPVAAIPCPIAFGANPGDFPSNPLNIPLIGKFGDVDGSVRCDRQFRFVPRAVESFFPSDVTNVPVKVAHIILQAANHLIDYLCLCYDAAYAILFDDEQAIHRKFVARSFCKPGVSDSDCESWSLLKNCTSIGGCIPNPNADTQRNARFLKVSDLAAKGDAAMCAVAGQESTLACIDSLVSNVSTDVATLQSGVDGVLTDLADLDTGIAAVDASVQAVQQQSGDTTASLTVFQELSLQLRIEADLVRQGDARVSLFQLPQSVGGHIETVAAIVTDAIDQRQNAGRDVGVAIRYLDLAESLRQEGAYKKAYTQYRNAYREVVLTRN